MLHEFFPDYPKMQRYLNTGYREIQKAANSPRSFIAPVGIAYELIYGDTIFAGGTETSSPFSNLYSGARRAEKWSSGMVGASSKSNSSRLEKAKQWSDRNINDGSTQSQISDLASQRGSISGNENRVRSRYSERTNEAAWQAFLYVIAYAVTHVWAFVVFNIELGGGTNPFYLLFIENFFWPLQGFANVFIFLRPRIRARRKSSPEMFDCTAACHSAFHYDEAYWRSSKPASLPDRPGEGSQPKSGTADTSDSFQKSTSEESDAITTTPVTYGIKERCYETEESLQPVIHGETSTDHDADEGPRIAKILYLPRSPNLKDDNFQHVNHEEAPGHRDAD